MRKFLVAAFLASVLPAAGASAQQQIVLGANNVVGASSVYDQGAGSQGAAFVRNGARVTGQYGVGNIFNDQLTAPRVETFSFSGTTGSYFLTGDGRTNEPTVANPYITIDLGAAYTLTSFSLFNTSNGGNADRGTANFTILGANSLDGLGLAADGNNGFTLGGATTVLVNSALARQQANTAPVAQTFASLSNGTFRYIQFLPTSASAGAFNNDSRGLNELRVFGTNGSVEAAVPEPATWAMMIGGFGAVGAASRRCRRTTLRFA